MFLKEVYDYVILLQPTSPFRTAEDIQLSLDLLINYKGDSVVSVTGAPSDLAFSIGFANRLRSIPNIVVPNGALYLATNEALINDKGWFGDFAILRLSRFNIIERTLPHHQKTIWTHPSLSTFFY